MKQFRRLQLKASEIGINSVVVIHGHDPLNGYSYKRAMRTGDHYAAYGALSIVLDDLKDQLKG